MSIKCQDIDLHFGMKITCLEQILYVDNQIEGYQLFYILISL